MAEVIYINRKDANTLAWRADLEEFKTIYEEQVESRRWESDHLLVIERKSDGKLFSAYFSLGLTEYQEREPFEPFDANADDKIEFVEFEEKEVVQKIYVPVKEPQFSVVK